MAVLTSLSEAVAEWIHDGDTVAMEGFTHLIPHAAGHEVIRQGRRNLTLIRMTPDVIYDQLIGVGAARRVVFAWGGNPGVGSLHRFRDAVENGWPGPLETLELTHGSMAVAYAAGAAGLPHGVLRGGAGTDLPAVSDALRWTECPFTGERLLAVAAHRPDVAVIHAQRADREGNVQLWGIVGVQKEAVLAARRAIVTVEELVDRLEPVPGAVVLPEFAVTAVCLVPGGAHPSYTQGYDRRDNAFYRRWDAVSRDRERFLAWIDRHVRGTEDAAAYRRSLRAAEREVDPPAPRGTDATTHGARQTPGGGPTNAAGPTWGGASPGATGSAAGAPPTPDEVMTIVAARALPDGAACFVGIGLPSAAANLARRLHAPGLVLVYESGTIGSRPDVLPLSIGDGELAETADAVVSVAEIFAYWLQGGRIDLGFLGAAQIDRFGNLNSTVIGPYDAPRVRLPGAGGASEIATSAKEVFVMLRQSPRTFVERLDFVTSPGFLDGGDARRHACLPGGGPTRVITDLGVLEPDPATRELVLTIVHPGVTVDQVREATGWTLRVADDVRESAQPTDVELAALRELKARTARAHGG
jgi:glutaconate CoA-transferase subunit A